MGLIHKRLPLVATVSILFSAIAVIFVVGQPDSCDVSSYNNDELWTQRLITGEHQPPLRHFFSVSRRCQGLRAVMILKDCANGPWGKSQMLREQFEAVFGNYTCFSLVYGYLPVAYLADNYDVIYIDGSGADFETVSDWLSAGNMEDGAAVFLEQLAHRGKKVFFNAAPLLDDEEDVRLWPLPFGAKLILQKNSHFMVGVGGILNGSYTMRTNVYSGRDKCEEDPCESVTPEDVYFAHGSIGSLGSSYLPLIITKDPGYPLLVGGVGETAAANVMLGALTTSDMHLPQPDATFLRLNILEGLCGGISACNKQCLYETVSSAKSKNKLLTNECHHCYLNLTSKVPS